MMNRSTLALFLLLAVVATGGAQVAPPAPPKPARPVAAPSPASRPFKVMIPEFQFDLDLSEIERIKEHALEITEQAKIYRIDADAIREATRLNLKVQREAMDRAREALQAVPVQIGGWQHDEIQLPHPYYQGEPEDSAYRLARELLNRGDYGRAAQMFKEIAQKYPKSVYASDLPYYEAYARYKIGTTEELRTAVKLLEPRASKLTPTVSQSGNAVLIGSGRTITYSGRRSASDGDVVTLYTRINSTLASRGDRSAADRVSQLAQAGANTCDPDEMSIRIEALSALTSMDPTAAMPKIRQVLENKDECSERLRQRAVFILGSKRGDAEAAALIAQAAKGDPSRNVRTEAINWLPKLQGDAGVAALEELLRTETNESIQRSIVRTLTSSDNAKARASMRTLIDRKDAPVSLRIEAINSLSSGDRATSDDAAYLRSLYSKADNDRMREAIINSVARMGGQENEQWVLNIAKNPNESSQARSTAISRLIRSNMPIADVARLYDAADSYPVRSQIVGMLAGRKEPEATDKLIDIAKNSTVQQLRLQAIQVLTNRKNDPRAAQLLLDIVDGKSKTP